MKKLGIIAGKGALPQKIYEYCKANKIECFIAYISEQDEDSIISKNSHFFKIGEVGKILKFFKQHKCNDLILAGSLKKPNFKKIKIDFKGFILLGKILRNKLAGDNAMLTTIISFLEKNKFNIIEVDKIVPNLHLEKGNNNKIKLTNNIKNDIKFGVEILKSLSQYDIGQAIIIQNKRIIGIEAVEGTDELILRSKEYIEDNNYPALLIKILKTNQDRRADLPTIGIKTIENMHRSNIKGVAIDVENCIVIEKEDICKYAEEKNIFIYGI